MSLFRNTFIEVTVIWIIPAYSGDIKTFFLKSDLFSSSCRKMRTVRTRLIPNETSKHYFNYETRISTFYERFIIKLEVGSKDFKSKYS